MKTFKILFPITVAVGLLISCAGSIHTGDQAVSQGHFHRGIVDNYSPGQNVVLYNFENRDRQDWVGSNHFEGFVITDEWSSEGNYSLKGILTQQSQAHWEPELTKIYRPRGKDYSRFQSISVDVRHQTGDCDPGSGLYARIYLTDSDENWIGSSKAVPIGTETKTITMHLPNDLSEQVSSARLNNIWRVSVQFLPCPSSTGNIDIYIDNFTAQLVN